MTELLKRLETTPDVVRLNSFRPEILGDCTVGDLRQSLSLESVRSEALEEAAKVCDQVAQMKWDKGAAPECARRVRALQSPARVAESCVHEWTDATNHVVSGTEICLKCFELRGMSARAPESPAKEQPGEQNAAPQVSPPVRPGWSSSNVEADETRRELIAAPLSDERKTGPTGALPSGSVTNAHADSASPAVAAPDVAAMVKEMRQMAEDCEFQEITDLLDRAAALIEKLGQGWIPLSGYSEARARFGGEGIRVEGYVTFIYATNGSKWIAFPFPPPPERP